MPKLRSRRPVILGTAGCLVLVGAAGSFASTGTSDPGYRTTTARIGDVQQLLNLTGTIAVVSKASAGFPVAGRVATVTAQVGDLVAAGQVLATLATAPLTDAVTQAAAAVAQAHATLETDQAAVTLPALTPVAGVAPATGAASVETGGGRSSHLASGSSLSPQRAVTQALDQAAKAMQDALQIVAAAQIACAPRPANSSTPDATPSSAPTSTLSASPDASPNSTPRPRQSGGQSATGSTRRSTPPSAGEGPADCLGAQSAALAALQVLATHQRDVTTAQQWLSAALAAIPTSRAGATNTTTGLASVSTRSGSARSRSTVGGQGEQSPAARVTLDQAAVLATQASLDAANRNLAGSTLTSPIGGRISTQPFTVGGLQTVGTRVGVVGPGAVEVTVDVPETSLRLIQVGQAASVIANGATASVAGSVTAIGLLPITSTTSSSSAYPVTVLVPQPTTAFVSGAAAAVTVIVTSVHAILTVPNSALSMAVPGGRHTVNVLTTGKPVRTPVEVGAAGALLTEITSGLQVGQILVLADPRQVLPASSATLPTIRPVGPNSGGGRAGKGGGAPGRATRG